LDEELLERVRENEPDEEERDMLEQQHEEHFVRWCEPHKTEAIEKDGVVIAEVELDGCDLYCFTCGEYVGFTGIEWSQPPRSRSEAFWKGGPPEEVTDLNVEIWEATAWLVKRTLSDHPHIETVEGAVEFIQGGLEKYPALKELNDVLKEADAPER